MRDTSKCGVAVAVVTCCCCRHCTMHALSHTLPRCSSCHTHLDDDCILPL